MLDFILISTRSTKRGTIEIYPKFIIPTSKKSGDLMIRGGDFYAIWNEETKLWSTDESDALKMIDDELDKFAKENSVKFDGQVKILHMWDAESGMIDRWHKYCQKQLKDSFHMLDEKLIFSNTDAKKTDYASRRLSYPLQDGDTSAWDQLVDVLYSPEEKKKIEWAIGSIVSGESKKIQKFMVFYGAAGTGKSTVLNIIQNLFNGYYSVFDAKSLGSSNNAFALEAFKSNPLVAIQHDGDLSRIEDNTRLNSLVSHEMMTVNEKFKSTYSNKFKCFLFMGTNKPVKITDAKSGLIRRLIDVSPTGDTVPAREYRKLISQIAFELGPIANKCLKFYEENKDLYDDYIPVNMLGASNDFYNFVVDNYLVFKKEDGVSLSQAWEMYKTYCDQAKVPYPMSKRSFKEELKNYFYEYSERFGMDDGTRVRNYYKGFRIDKFEETNKKKPEPDNYILQLDKTESLIDEIYADCKAQYANDEGHPRCKWVNCRTKLKDLDTKKLHYVQLPKNHIVIDLDIPDETGSKSFIKNLEAASKFPPTYAELSKSGSAIHLHYIYDGDAEQLKKDYAEHIEIKIPKGDSALRRMVTKCNGMPIAHISSGLPLKEKGEKLVDYKGIENEKMLMSLIKNCLDKKHHGSTKPEIDYIYAELEKAYNNGMSYEIPERVQRAIINFAAKSTNQSDYCLKMVNKMKWRSKDREVLEVATDEEQLYSDDAPIVFYDVEVFPNLFLVNWKKLDGGQVVRMINPTADEIEEITHFRLVGFNCRRYDNHILYARLMGYTNEQLFNLSQKIIDSGKQQKDVFFGNAYNLSYTDIYDYASKKQSLKKWEIELGIHHQELGLPWDQPVPEEMWEKVAEYCDNDVIATEAVWKATQADFTARQILAELAHGTVNDTTNMLTTRIIFGNNRKPQDQFNYRNMACEGSPTFPGYEYKGGKSTYRGEEIGEGGYVYAEPGIYYNVALLDIASMHPSSIIAENLFGDEYTKIFASLVDARIVIKHKDFDTARKMLNGVLAKYLDDESAAKNLAGALKIAINSVYGLTAATFPNPFKDPRNKDNIVAKRGALFMVNLKHEVQNRGYTVVHIKTDSIKIANADDEIISFVTEYGKLYGYNFEHEATYKKICLVNDAVYIAQDASDNHWTATGTQFQVPYVFKALFSHEDIEFDDMCETKSVTSSLYLDMNEDLPNVSAAECDLAKLEKQFKDGKVKEYDYENLSYILLDEISKGHDYRFIGKVGRFCPVVSGIGGGLLRREKDGKYYAVTGTKKKDGSSYRWLEAEMVKELGKENYIDESYYTSLVDDAIEAVNKAGEPFGIDYNMFVDDNYIPEVLPRSVTLVATDEELPFPG